MILRTPPQRKRKADPAAELVASASASASVVATDSPDGRVVLYDAPVPLSSFEPSDDMVCTYHCRQMVKSEFMVALSTAEKQVQDYQSRLQKMEVEHCKSEEDRKKYRDQLCLVEQDLEATRGREHALQERLLKEVDDSQERYQIQLKRCCELEILLKKEVDSRKSIESSASSAEDRALELEEKLRKLSESTEREKSRLLRELSHMKDEAKLSIFKISADLEKMKMRAGNSEEELELLKGQLKVLGEQLNECLQQKSEAEHKLSKFTASSHERNTLESQTLVKHLQEELRSYEAEVHEARRLKASYENIDLLKEKLSEEKFRRESAETELLKLQKSQLNFQRSEHELMLWKSLLTDIPDVSCYDDIPRKFAGLQKEAIENMMKFGEANTRVKELEVALELADLNRQYSEKESALAKEKAENLASEVKRFELLLTSVTEERDRLRKDTAMWIKQRCGLADGGLANETSVKDLESSLDERERSIREMECNILEQRTIINRQHDELKLMNARLSTEARKVKSLEREGDRLRSEMSLLESKLGHGDYSSANTKVLRMVNTLAVDSEAKHAIEALRAELQKAHAKLQAVEELKGQSAAGNIIDADIPEKLAQLKRQIAILEKREERYKSVFAERISVFRRACCSLFGYKIVMDDQQRPNGIPVTHFSLQSIYAQNDEEKLEFDYESGNTNILVNDYTSQPEISHQVEIFIKKMNSIPAFTANLTIESFNKRTLS